MGNLTDSELSRVLHDIAPTPPLEPGRMESIRRRVRRTQRRRRSVAVVGVTAAVAAVVSLPSGLLDRGGNERTPVLTALADAPVRGDLADEPNITAAAMQAWVNAQEEAQRDPHVSGRLIFAGRVGPEVVAVIAGVAPHAGDRLVVLAGPSVSELRFYADQSDTHDGSLRVLLGEPPRLPDGVERFDCNRPPSTTVVKRPLLTLDTTTGTSRGRWKTVNDAQDGCRGHKSSDSAFTDFTISDGVGITTVRSTADQSVQVFTPAMSGDLSMHVASSIGPLPGGRVDPGAPVEALSPPVVTVNQSPDGTGSEQLTTSVGPDGKDPDPSPLGWRYRYDDAPNVDSYEPLVREYKGSSTGPQALSLAAPDGTQVGMAVVRTETEQRVGIVSVVDGEQSVLLDTPLDSSNLPKQLSAVYAGRDGNRWLFVAGAPGTYDIAYRAPGEKTWVSSDYVYMSSTFIELKAGDQGDGQLRLTSKDGSLIYEGPR